MSGTGKKTGAEVPRRSNRGKEKGDGAEGEDEVFVRSGWPGFKEEWFECEGEGCKVWQMVRVPEEWKAEKSGAFYCGVCTGKELNKLRIENADLREKLRGKADIAIEGRISQQIDTYAETLKKNIETSKSEVLDTVEKSAPGGEEWIKVVRKEVKENTAEERRKKRIIVFGLNENGRDKEDITEIISELKEGTKLVKIERMRKKEGEEGVKKPVIVEFESEREKWDVLEKKKELKDKIRWKDVFLEMDLSREKREERRRRATERVKGTKKTGPTPGK